ncbi:16875_t:CDS:1, partial [Funneliformis geosporum]
NPHLEFSRFLTTYKDDETYQDLYNSYQDRFIVLSNDLKLVAEKRCNILSVEKSTHLVENYH